MKDEDQVYRIAAPNDVFFTDDLRVIPARGRQLKNINAQDEMIPTMIKRNLTPDDHLRGA